MNFFIVKLLLSLVNDLKRSVVNLKNLTKSVGFIIYFIAMQCIASVGFVFYKMFFDSEWSEKVYTLVSNNQKFSREYLELVSQAVMPMLIVADILIMIPMLLYAYKKKIKLYRKIEKVNALQIVSFIVESLPASITTSQYDQLTSLILTDNVFITFLTSAILAPVIEELIFRFGICGIYKDEREKAILVSAFMFGLAHFNLIQSTYAFILGIVLAYVYTKSQNLLTSTLMHITINGSSILYEYFNHTVVLIAGIAIIIVTLLMMNRRDTNGNRGKKILVIIAMILAIIVTAMNYTQEKTVNNTVTEVTEGE